MQPGPHPLDADTLRTLLDIAPDAIAIVRAGTVLYMSPTGARMLGYTTAREVVGISMADWMDPEDVALAGRRIAEVMRTGRALDLPQEYRARTQEGRSIVVEVASVPITYEGAPAVLAFVRDVTERKALERQVAESTRLAALGRLSAGVAHELNNPLTHLVLAVDRLRRSLAAAGPDRAADVIADIQGKLEHLAQDVQRMVVIARELRLFASPQAGARGPVVLEHVLERVLDTVTAGGQPPARVERRYAEVAPADADPDRLAQVFGNLIRNAFDSLTDAGTPSPLVTLTVRADGTRLAVDVWNNGPGIPPEMRERIFEPFFTTKAYGAGAGLGLAISRAIVQAIDGELEVDSAPDSTTFTVTLPAWRRATVAAVPERAPAVGRLRVLVIDDEAAIGSTLQSILEDQHDVVVTTGVRDAMTALARDAAFDLVLCDVVMPGASGIDFLDQLRTAHPRLVNRVVFMTGATLGSDQGRALAALPNQVLEKPFELPQLERLLADVSSRR
ncbi:MAG TPA: ATP-binding protein [Kofleriaceae bacterium]|nr:ATP-binding protein [Kofleriaceae bacterium]